MSNLICNIDLQDLIVLQSVQSHFFLSLFPLSLFFVSLGTVTNVPTTIGITVLQLFQISSQYLSIFSTSFYLHSIDYWNSKIQEMRSFFFLLNNTWSGLVFWAGLADPYYQPLSSLRDWLIYLLGQSSGRDWLIHITSSSLLNRDWLINLLGLVFFPGLADPFYLVWSSGRDWLIHIISSGLLAGVG